MLPAMNQCPKAGLLRCIRQGFVAVGCLSVVACSVVMQRDGPGRALDADNIADAVPRSEPRSRYGNPDSYEVLGRHYHTLKSSNGFRQRGIASWYGKKFHGRKTSSGEIYDMYQMTAAHKILPLPTYVKVSNLENGRSAILKVNDRGPFHENRIIDLSYAAALKLGITTKGTAFVEVTALNNGSTFRVLADEPAQRSSEAVFGLYLQIGAFNERRNAQRLSEHVTSHLLKNVRIREASRGNKSIYRVQVGPIATVELADRLVNMLVALGISDHHFVSD